MPMPPHINPQADQVLIAVNPRSGRGPSAALVEALAAELSRRQLHPRLIGDLDQLASAAARLHAAGSLRLVVTAGGDGTLAEVVNRVGPEMVLAPFPLGTANLMANYLGFSRDVPRMAGAIAAGQTTQLDAGLANGRIFLMMIGCGFDGEVVHRLHAARQGHIRYWSYLKPVWSAIRSYQYPALRIYCDPLPDGTSEPLTAAFAFVSNLPTYGGGFRFSPLADPADGQLNVCALRGASLWRGLWYAALARAGRLDWSKGCQQATCRRLRIEADGPARYQLDGDPGGQLPLDVAVLPRRLTLLAMPDTARPEEVADRA